MAKAGADIIVAHMGVTTGGSIGAETAKSLDDCVREVDAIAEAAQRGAQGRHRPLPWRADRDARTTRSTFSIAARTATASTAPSSMERLPTEIALTAQTRTFKAIKRRA